MNVGRAPRWIISIVLSLSSSCNPTLSPEQDRAKSLPLTTNSKIKGFVATATDSTSVELTWSAKALGDGETVRVGVLASAIAIDDCSNADRPTKGESMTIANLKSGTNYTFYLCVFRDDKPDPQSIMVATAETHVSDDATCVEGSSILVNTPGTRNVTCQKCGSDKAYMEVPLKECGNQPSCEPNGAIFPDPSGPGCRICVDGALITPHELQHCKICKAGDIRDALQGASAPCQICINGAFQDAEQAQQCQKQPPNQSE